jgi:FrmR/RcnR family transcriptional regulator, repressor of frmRAB operon
MCMVHSCRLKRSYRLLKSLLLALCSILPYSFVKAKMHTIREKEKQILRVRRIRGQIEALERALTNEVECSDVLQLITAARGALNGLMAELVEDHVRFHVLDPKQKPTSEQALAADELVDIIRSYLK